MLHDLSDDEPNDLIHDQESGNENDHENNENEDGVARRVDPATSRKRIVRNPIPKLNPARLRGPKGIHTIEKYFEGFKFNSKGHEKIDVDRIMKRLEHWAHRLFPKYQFDDFLEKVETLGSKREMQTFLTKYRRDLLTDEEIVNSADGDVIMEREPSPEPIDQFDLLIAEQIEKTKQVTMPQQSQINVSSSHENVNSTTNNTTESNNENVNLTHNFVSSDEVKKRIERNRQLAIERKLARMKQLEENRKNKIQASSVEKMSQISSISQVDKSDLVSESEVITDIEITSHTEEISNRVENENSINAHIDSEMDENNFVS